MAKLPRLRTLRSIFRSFRLPFLPSLLRCTVLVALVALGHFWLLMAKASTAALAGDPSDFGKDFHEAKLITANHFFARQLIAAHTHAAEVRVGADTLMAMPAESF